MTKEREALKLALAALEEAHYKHEHRQDATKRGQAITAIKEALAQPEAEAHLQAVSDFGQLQAQIDERNFCQRCGKLLPRTYRALTSQQCCPPTAPTGWDNGLSQDYDKKLGAWFSEKPNAKEELRARTFDDYGNKIV